MPYFISPLSSQLTVEHKLSWCGFFSHNLVFLSDLPFSVCRHVSPSLSFSLSLPFSLSSPFRRICHGNVKKSQLLQFISCSFSRERRAILFLLTSFCVLRFKGNEDHISSAWSYMTGRGWAGLLWENKYYGRSNFVIFISPGSMCVLLDRIHYTNTKARMQCAHMWAKNIMHASSNCIYTICKHTHT